MAGAYGQLSEMEIATKETKRIQNILYDILAERTGKPIKQIAKDADRDKWMNAQDALEYGIIDKILTGKGIL